MLVDKFIRYSPNCKDFGTDHSIWYAHNLQIILYGELYKGVKAPYKMLTKHYIENSHYA